MSNRIKAQLRIPTNEQYAYIEVSVEGTPDEIVEEYKQLTKLIKGGNEGLERKEWNKVLDTYLWDCTMVAEEYERMSDNQRSVIQEIKKSKARCDKRQNSELNNLLDNIE